jgi:integral membrane protein
MRDGALLRYRVMAWIVGVLLIVLVFVAIPLQLAGHPRTVEIVGQVHGFMYIVYVIVAFLLSIRERWPLLRTVLVLLAGTIPIMSFVAERKVTGWVNARRAQATVPART